MEVPIEFLMKWKLTSDHGDITEIARESGYSRITISQAINNGKCSEKVFVAIKSFYDKREQLFKTA